VLGIPAAQVLDALVFSSPSASFRDVMVAGRWVLRDSRHPNAEAIAKRFEAAMREIWAER
jgi:formimidoylglutamate deiminase